MNAEVSKKMARRIYSTQRFREWGDFKFLLAYYVGANENSDSTPVDLGLSKKGSRGQIDVYYNSQYPGIVEAIQAFNKKHSYNLDIPDLTNPRVRTTLDISMEELVAITRKCTPLDPPILLAWEPDLIDEISSYIDYSKTDSNAYKMFFAGFEEQERIELANESIFIPSEYVASVKKTFFDN